MGHLLVIDSVALISYFSSVFEVKCKISKHAYKLIERAFNKDLFTRISVPSIVFVEIFEKWFNSEV